MKNILFPIQRWLIVIVSFWALSCSHVTPVSQPREPLWPGVKVGMTQQNFLRSYPKALARTYRSVGNEEWMTYNHPIQTPHDKARDVVTFHFAQGFLEGWSLNDRAEVVEEYLSEYCSQSIIHYLPKTYAAIKQVLRGVPHEVFIAVTNRARPVVFTEYHYIGMGRFANSSEIFSFADDAPSMMDGITIMKLSTELEDIAPLADDIAGVVAHELAHRHLEHARKKMDVCKREREANRLVRTWGFEKEFARAKETFGDPQESKVMCPDIDETKE